MGTGRFQATLPTPDPDRERIGQLPDCLLDIDTSCSCDLFNLFAQLCGGNNNRLFIVESHVVDILAITASRILLYSIGRFAIVVAVSVVLSIIVVAIRLRLLDDARKNLPAFER